MGVCHMGAASSQGAGGGLEMAGGWDTRQASWSASHCGIPFSKNKKISLCISVLVLPIDLIKMKLLWMGFFLCDFCTFPAPRCTGERAANFSAAGKGPPLLSPPRQESVVVFPSGN